MPEPLLTVKGVHKRFGPVHALKGVDLQIYPGEVQALIGENGAGKSTLMKVLSGAHEATEGEIFLDGQPYSPRTPDEGRKAGISMIYQELTLAPHLTVEENITLGVEHKTGGFFAKSRRKEVEEALAMLGRSDVRPDQKVSELNIGTRQMIEIARAIVCKSRVIIMDEPTSSLSREDVANLFKVTRELRDRGIAIVYISHFLEELQEIADRFTILRDGSTVGTGMMAGVTIPEIAEMMVGRSLDEMYPTVEHEISEVVMEVKDLAAETGFPHHASLTLRKGEILGIFGLVGAGRSEMVRCIYGLDKAKQGSVKILGKEYSPGKANPKMSLFNSLDLLSEDRKTEGLAQGLSIAVNTSLSALYKESKCGFINLKHEKQNADEWAKKLQTKCHSTLDPISSLSGGNQQKVAIARIMNHDSQILFFDEPTRGIDVGSKAEIYRLIQQLASEGKSVIVVSSYLPELQGVCDSIAVMYRGILSPSHPVDQWTKNDVMLFATTGKMPEKFNSPEDQLAAQEAAEEAQIH